MAQPDYRGIERRRKAGRGEGSGAEYRPWIKARESRSRGVLHRCFGMTTGRMHEFLSTWEYRCFLLLEWNPLVIDIREQFPLHLIDETRAIADALSVRHPAKRRRVKGKGYIEEDVVMTTDFMVTLAPAATIGEAMIAVKPCGEMGKPRVLEKLEIERTYAERHRIPWRLATERELPIVLTDNLSLILPCRNLDGYDLPRDELPALLGYLFRLLSDSPREPVSALCSKADRRLSLEPGSSLTLVWHAIATRAWLVDLEKQLDPAKPLPDLRLGSEPYSSPSEREVA